MEYKLEPLNLVVDKAEDIVIPSWKERVIEKRGHVVKFSLDEIEQNTKKMLQNKKELQAKLVYEQAVIDNIEHFHKFVKKLDDEKLLTVWMYKNSKGHVDVCNAKIAEIDNQIKDDEIEVAEIKKQIPELNNKSADVVEGEVELVGDKA